jgi:hypothetical protein
MVALRLQELLYEQYLYLSYLLLHLDSYINFKHP